MADEKSIEEKTYQERIAICKECDKRIGRLITFSKCGECGCPIATKALLPMWHCPLKKW